LAAELELLRRIWVPEGELNDWEPSRRYPGFVLWLELADVVDKIRETTP
jgi:hypothetical protein